MLTTRFDSLTPSPRSPLIVTIAAVLLCTLAGCGGSNPYALEVGELADRFMPTVREVDSHPDSLQHLSIEETNDKLTFNLQRDYQDLHQYWSSRFELSGTGRNVQQPMGYATMWSKELSLAALQADQGVTGLDKDRASKIIEREKQDYQKRLQIDVYWFSEPGETSIFGSGTQVQLRDDQGNIYRPVTKDRSPVRNAYLGAGERALYRRNTLVFERVVDGRDVLNAVQKLTLRLRPPNATTNVHFEWTWEESNS